MLERPEQFHALVSPMRRLVMRTISFKGPISVSELAEKLERSAESLHYHVRALEGVGLLKVVGTRPTARRQERLFDVLGDVLALPDDAFVEGSEWADAQENVVRTDFRILIQKYVDGIRDHSLRKSGPVVEHECMVLTGRLSDEGLERLTEAAEELRRVFQEESAKGKGREYQLGFLLAPHSP